MSDPVEFDALRVKLLMPAGADPATTEAARAALGAPRSSSPCAVRSSWCSTRHRRSRSCPPRPRGESLQSFVPDLREVPVDPDELLKLLDLGAKPARPPDSAAPVVTPD